MPAPPGVTGANYTPHRSTSTAVDRRAAAPTAARHPTSKTLHHPVHAPRLDTETSPMPSLVVYGSLMHPKELQRHGIDSRRASPVDVYGLHREFAQEPSWRRGSGDARGVLTVVSRTEGSFNGLLVRDIDRETLHAFDHRERGYHRIRLDPARVAPRPPKVVAEALADVFLYVGKPERYNHRLRPNRAYLDTCLRAAASVSEAFLTDFLHTTSAAGFRLSDPRIGFDPTP